MHVYCDRILILAGFTAPLMRTLMTREGKRTKRNQVNEGGGAETLIL